MDSSHEIRTLLAPGSGYEISDEMSKAYEVTNINNTI